MAESEKARATGWPRRYGRYLVFEEFARGGMASVHLGRLVADRGFSRLVAVKMLSEDRAASSFYVRALEDEARIASRVRHPNVVQPLDVVAERGDVLYVMEYVHGVALAHLLDAARANGADPPLAHDVTVAVMLDVLSALHAAHEAKDETGRPLGVVHRDVSPQNVLVGVDGLARLADFGVAKAMRREERTATGAVKGKVSYMSPEQQRGLPVTRQADIYAAGVVLAVSLTNAPPAPIEAELTAGWLRDAIARIEDRALLDIVTTATKAQARDRFSTAAEMAAALASACPRAAAEAVGACVQDLAGEVLELRGELARRVESAVADADDDAPTLASAPPPAHASAPPPALASAPPPAHASAPPPALASAPPPPAFASAPPPAPAPARSFTPIFLFLFSAALVVAVFLYRRDPVASPSAVPPRPQETAVEAPPSPASPPATASTSISASAPSASAIPAGTHASSAARPRSGPRPRLPDERSAPPPPHAADCDPPFRIDSQGRKHYKPECVP